ncbi:MAG: TonB-dependent receptor, partial [Myxococcota bacterium]
VLLGNVFRRFDRQDHYVGGGNALRAFLAGEWFWAKTSYEYAIRLPEALEVFGDGLFIQPNARLLPERSHNANVGLQIDHQEGGAGRFRANVFFFLRQVENQIVLLPTAGDFLGHENVSQARSQGVEVSLAWTSPGDWVSVLGNLTYVDLRNRSSEGDFGSFQGDRIPGRPFLTANGNASFVASNIVRLRDELRLGGDVRFVESFFRGWESQGDLDFKARVRRQAALSTFVSYGFGFGYWRLTATFEITNLNNTELFDFFGVQNPPRSYFLKVTGEYRAVAHAAARPVPAG